MAKVRRWDSIGYNVKADLEGLTLDPDVRRRWPQAAELLYLLGRLIFDVELRWSQVLSGEVPLAETDAGYDQSVLTRAAQAIAQAQASAGMPSLDKMVDLEARPYVAPATVLEANERYLGLQAEIGFLSRELAARTLAVTEGRMDPEYAARWKTQVGIVRSAKEHEASLIRGWMRAEMARQEAAARREAGLVVLDVPALEKRQDLEAERTDHIRARAAAQKARLADLQRADALARDLGEQTRARLAAERLLRLDEEVAAQEKKLAELRLATRQLKAGGGDSVVSAERLWDLHAAVLNALDTLDDQHGLPPLVVSLRNAAVAALPREVREEKMRRRDEAFQAAMQVDPPIVESLAIRVAYHDERYVVRVEEKQIAVRDLRTLTDVPLPDLATRPWWVGGFVQRARGVFDSVQRSTRMAWWRHEKRTMGEASPPDPATGPEAAP